MPVLLFDKKWVPICKLFLFFYMKIKLLKILALLGSGDKKASEQMYTIVGDIMRKSDSSSNIGNAILYECICCVASIHPNPKVLETAAEAVAKFLKVRLLLPACVPFCCSGVASLLETNFVHIYLVHRMIAII